MNWVPPSFPSPYPLTTLPLVLSNRDKNDNKVWDSFEIYDPMTLDIHICVRRMNVFGMDPVTLLLTDAFVTKHNFAQLESMNEEQICQKFSQMFKKNVHYAANLQLLQYVSTTVSNIFVDRHKYYTHLLRATRLCSTAMHCLLDELTDCYESDINDRPSCIHKYRYVIMYQLNTMYIHALYMHNI